MRFTLLTVLLLASICVVEASEEVICGQVSNTTCPGCSATTPGACNCAVQGSDCNCNNTAYLITCGTEDFDWITGAYVISDGPMKLCETVKKCSKSNLTQDNCGIPGAHGCLITANCQWNTFGEPTNRRTYIQSTVECPPGDPA